MTRRTKAVVGLLSVFLILLPVCFLFLRYQIRKSFPITSGSVTLASLGNHVEVFRDAFHVPVIHASSEHDLMLALGFVHAQDRLWQMDLARRAGEGRLSEIFGEKTVPFDVMFRVVGIREIARKVEEALTPESRNILAWYAEGVNNYVDAQGGKLPVEFDLLGYQPEPWQPLHSLVIAQMMAWELNLSWWTDLTLGSIANRVGLEKALDVFPSYPRNVPPIVPGKEWQSIAEVNKELLDVAFSYRRFFGLPAVSSGSNAWVIGPSKSSSGKVILANDPHLHLQLPSKWYELYLRGAGYDVGGMTIPGIPGVVIGNNLDIVWGLTNTMADEADFYVEKIDTADTSRYWYDGHWLPIHYRSEEIRIKGDSSVSITVRSTHHGPIVSDIHTSLQKARSPFVASMRWTGAEVSDRVGAFNKINRATNWQEFLLGVAEFGGPGQNFVYGDKNGNIGYWCGTRVPIRGKQTATLPLPGWDKSAEWRGFVPFDQMPHLYNPPQSYIATANNKVADESFPHHISDLWEPPSRIQRLHRVLSREGTFSIQDFERLQNDLYSVYAEEMLPHILAACLDSAVEIPEHQRILEYLRNWNLNFTREDIATTIFQATFVRLLHNIYQDEMGDDLFHDFVILGNIPLRVTLRLVMEGTSTWFDDMMTPDIESCNDILRKSVGEAVRELQSKLGTEMKAWRWGALHTLTLQHPFGLQKPLDRIFNVGPFPVAGGPTVLASSEYSFNEPYGVTVAASFRRIVDFARPDEVRSVLPSGQCGQVFHDHYDDQTQLWLSGAYRTFRTDSAVVSGPGWDRLTLKPKK